MHGAVSQVVQVEAYIPGKCCTNGEPSCKGWPAWEKSQARVTPLLLPAWGEAELGLNPCESQINFRVSEAPFTYIYILNSALISFFCWSLKLCTRIYWTNYFYKPYIMKIDSWLKKKQCKKETCSRDGLTYHLLQYKCLFQNWMETGRHISFIFLPCLWLVASLSMRCSKKDTESWQDLSVQLYFSIEIAWNNKLHAVLRQSCIQGLARLNRRPGLFAKFWKLFD